MLSFFRRYWLHACLVVPVVVPAAWWALPFDRASAFQVGDRVVTQPRPGVDGVKGEVVGFTKVQGETYLEVRGPLPTPILVQPAQARHEQ